MGLREERILSQMLSDIDQCDLLDCTFTQSTKRYLRNIIKSVQIPQFGFMTAAQFAKTVDQVFADGVVNWGRILTLYAFEYNFIISNPDERIAARMTIHQTMMTLLRTWIEENDPILDDLVTRSCAFRGLGKH